MNRIVKSLWIGEALTNNEILCIKSFLYHSHEFHLYAYSQTENLPSGVTLKDANDILPKKSLFRDSAGSFASFADWFRLKMLYELGGWWVDMDVICLRPFAISEPYCISSERKFGAEGLLVNNTCIKFPAKSIHLSYFISMIEKKINAKDEIEWGEVGIDLFRKNCVAGTELFNYVKDPLVFCPIDCFNLSELICKCDYHPSPKSLSIHLWNKIWDNACLDKNAIYHPLSIYEQLKLRYW